MYEIPAIEKIHNPAKFMHVSDNASARRSVAIRYRHASAICSYLARPNRGEFKGYFENLAAILERPENSRLALYLPLEELQDAPDYFRAHYMTAWRKCLHFKDVRENFNVGDSLELDARDENFPYVVKAAHLIPWLLHFGYIGEAYVLELLEHSNDCLVRSICDCEKLFYNVKLQTSPEFQLKISKRARSLPKKESKPLYDSAERKKWVEKLKQEQWGKTFPRNITGPFSDNINEWEMPQPIGDEIILLGGSYLKGYSAANSDIDSYRYDAQNKRVDTFCRELEDYRDVPNQNIAHICLNTIWVSNRRFLSEVQNDCICRYLKLPADSIERRQSLERLEQDLLQYRLMHKGIKRIYDNVSAFTSHFPAIDGSSAFYDRRYRRIATQLFVKYVFLPQL